MPHIYMLCSGHEITDARVTHKQAVSLVKMGYKVTVFGRNCMGENLPKVPGLELRPLMPAGGKLMARMRMILKLYQEAMRGRSDVITCHEPESALVGLLAGKRKGVPVLFDIHECFQDTLSSRMPRGLRGIVRALSVFLLKFLGRRCDWLTIVSPANLDFYRNIRGDGRISIIHNSPRMELFPPCNHDSDGPVVICHEGNLDHSRGMTQILESLKLARNRADVRLLIVGKIRPECRALFDKLADQMSLNEHIIIPGWKSYEEIGRMESTAHIGLVVLQPGGNTFKSLNNKLYNYMCCGQPVIVPKGSTSEMLVRQYDCGLVVDTTSPEDIADAIVLLAGDRELRKRFGANGRSAIEGHLGWHKMEEQLADIYGRLLANRQAAAQPQDDANHSI